GEPRPFPAEVAEDVDRAPDLAARLGQRLALLARHLARHLLGTRLEQRRRAVQDLAALRRRHGRPRRLRRGSRLDRLPGVGDIGLRKEPDDVVRVGRIAILERRTAGGANPLAADEVPEDRNAHSPAPAAAPLLRRPGQYLPISGGCPAAAPPAARRRPPRRSLHSRTVRRRLRPRRRTAGPNADRHTSPASRARLQAARPPRAACPSPPRTHAAACRSFP